MFSNFANSKLTNGIKNKTMALIKFSRINPPGSRGSFRRNKMYSIFCADVHFYFTSEKEAKKTVVQISIYWSDIYSRASLVLDMLFQFYFSNYKNIALRELLIFYYQSALNNHTKAIEIKKEPYITKNIISLVENCTTITDKILQNYPKSDKIVFIREVLRSLDEKIKTFSDNFEVEKVDYRN